MPITLLLLLSLVSAQNQESKSIPSDSVEVEARGCIKGRVFTAIATEEDEGARRGPEISGRSFRLTGKKDVMDTVKEANGERVEIVGIVRKAALADSGIGMKVGGTRVVIGAQGSDPGRVNQRAAPEGVAVMDVVAIRSLAERCPIQ
jgi:hypothetical protein